MDGEIDRLRFIFTTILLLAIIVIGVANLFVTRGDVTVDMSGIESEISTVNSNLDTINSRLNTLETSVSQIGTAVPQPETASPTLAITETFLLKYDPQAITYSNNFVYATLNNSVYSFSFDNFLEGELDKNTNFYTLDYTANALLERSGFVYVGQGSKVYQYSWESFLSKEHHVGDPYSLSYEPEAMFMKDNQVYLVKKGTGIIYKYPWNEFVSNGNYVSAYNLDFVPDAMMYYNGFVYVLNGNIVYKYSWANFNGVFK
jgi:hypothetical protein